MTTVTRVDGAPGTGKTYTLRQRLEDRKAAGLTAGGVKWITFTNAGTKDAVETVKDVFPGLDADDSSVKPDKVARTFHSLTLSLLYREDLIESDDDIEPDPVIEDITPEPDKLFSEGPVVIEANISDVSLPNDDTLTVEFRDDSGVFSTETLNANGTVTATYPQLLGGENEYSIDVSDTYGNTVSAGTRTFSIPSNLTLRDVNDASDIVDDPNVDATVRFFEEQGNTVFPRSPTNGVVDMTGLPVDESFVVGVRDDSGTYISRLTLIDTIFQQQDAYLINSSADTAIVRFNLEDRTGRFIAGETEIQILRSVNTTDSPADQEEYVIVAGDVIGSQLSFESELQEDVRYRVRVKNDNGEIRELGAFTARVDQTVDLTISGIDVGFDDDDTGTQVQTSATVAENGDKTIQFNLLDLSQSTTDISVTAGGRRSSASACSS